VVIWYIFPCFGILCQEKSGNPAKVVQVGEGLIADKMRSGVIFASPFFLTSTLRSNRFLFFAL
jgi:hypothetical protein